MTHDLGTIRGKNHPANDLSEARGFCWAQFTVLSGILNVLFHGAWVWDVTNGFHF